METVSGLYWDHERRLCIGCSPYCSNGANSCNTQTGECSSCQEGYFGSRCDQNCDIDNCTECYKVRDNVNEVIKCRKCDPEFTVTDGRLNCKSCSETNCLGMCDPGSEECPEGCLPGWFGEGKLCNRKCEIEKCESCYATFQGAALCNECQVGFYPKGAVCETCPPQCKDRLCLSHTGYCKVGCNDGYYGNKCEWKCSTGCINGLCNSTTGNCECKESFYGNRCDRNCPVYCTTESCKSFVDAETGCEACEAGRYGNVCENKCSSNCRPSGFNQYVYCNKTTGACHDGCVYGYYGADCSTRCGPGCTDSCDRWTGACQACHLSQYGVKCEFPCPENCVRTQSGYQRTCDVFNGACFLGCEAGFRGTFCNITCDPNKHCRNKVCDDKGTCVLGCEIGYTGPDCTVVCATGDCGNDCLPNCEGQVCDPVTKACVKGCRLGWWGEMCDKICSIQCQSHDCEQTTGSCVGDCQPGFYGATCPDLCSQNCKDGVCDKATGMFHCV